jgi:hypothetical protein
MSTKMNSRDMESFELEAQHEEKHTDHLSLHNFYTAYLDLGLDDQAKWTVEEAS